MKVNKEDIKDVAMATVKGAMSGVPFVGGLFVEYIDLAQGKIADKRMAQWMSMVENKLLQLQDRFDGLTSNELFYSCVQVATVNAMRSYQKEKRQLFANAIYNAALLDLAADKKLLFLSILDHHTLAGIKLLRYYSESHYHKEEYIRHGGMVTTYTMPGTEHPIKSILHDNPEFKEDFDYVKALSEQLAGDGLVSLIDFNIPENPERARRKRTTRLGDEFLEYINLKGNVGSIDF